MAIEEDRPGRDPFADERGEFGDGGRPQRTEALLSAFSGDFGAGGVQIQVGNLHLGGLGSSGSGVVEEPEKGVIAPALCRSLVRGREQRIRIKRGAPHFMREICTSGSVMGGGGNVPTYSALGLV